jgi:transcriptional repressor NrdR
LICPRCGNSDTKVLESRLSHEGHSIRRRRSCQNCYHRFTTYEKEEELSLQIRKKDNRFEEFNREKLTKAIATACRKRPIPIEQIETMVADIEMRLRAEGEQVVPSKAIGDLVMEALSKADHVAYVRFASIYKDFKDPAEFAKELESLREKKF